MIDELEPGPDPRKVRDPRSRRPTEQPVRVPDVLRSFNEDKAFSIRRNSEADALAVAAEIKAATYFLRRWEGYDIRVRPYVSVHWEDSRGNEHTIQKGQSAPAGARVYYKTNFWVHPPLPQGFRTMDADTADDLRRRATEARLGSEDERPAPRRRSVQQRAGS